MMTMELVKKRRKRRIKMIKLVKSKIKMMIKRRKIKTE